jgi:hypothetical protein
MEMVVRLIETVVMVMDSMEMAPGHFPVPAGCRNRDCYPPNLVGGGSGAAELLLEKY